MTDNWRTDPTLSDDEKELRDLEEETPAWVRRNLLFSNGFLLAMLIPMIGCLVSVSSLYVLLSSLCGAFLASRFVQRREPPPFGQTKGGHKKIRTPNYMFGEKYLPLREQLKRNVNPTRSPLYFALLMVGIRLAARASRNWLPGSFENPPPTREILFRWMSPGTLHLFYECFFSLLTAGLSFLVCLAWIWWMALLQTPFPQTKDDPV